MLGLAAAPLVLRAITSGIFNAQFHTKCTGQMKDFCNSQAYCLVAQGRRKVKSNKNGRFEYEKMGETQPEMGLLKVVALILSAKSGSLIPSAAECNSSTQHHWILYIVLHFLKNTLDYLLGQDSLANGIRPSILQHSNAARMADCSCQNLIDCLIV